MDDLKKHLSQKEMSLIVGARQVGKTTIMTELKGILEKKGERTLFLNLDFEEDKNFFNSQLNLVKRIELEFGQKSGYVFIDEIQRKENAGIFLKGIYDRNLPYKFIISGSGSLELKEKIHESLAGRKRVFELQPVSFKEFVDFKTNYRYEDRLSDFLKLNKEQALVFLKEYMKFGGYPRVVVEGVLDEKRKIIGEIFRSYLEKDISYLLKVEKVDAFSQMMKLLAAQVGNLVNYSELSSALNISLPTVKNYLWYAQKTFVLNLLTPHFKNKRQEVVKSPTVYFNDLGLRNYAIGLFSQEMEFENSGFIFQNFIFNLLREKFGESGEPRFWRTKDGAEVDFVLSSDKGILPIEVKCKKLKEPSVEHSLKSFIEKYKPREAWVVNLTLEKEIKILGASVKFLPFFKL